MPRQACRNEELRISGLQLPEDATLEGPAASSALAVCQTTTYRWSLADDLMHYPRAGIGGIGLYRPKLEEHDEEIAIDLVRSSGLQVTSLSWIGGFTGCDGARQADALFDAAEAIRLAAAIDAGTVAVVSGGAGNHIAKHARRLLVDSLRLACDQAADYGVQLALHPFASAKARSRTVLTNLDETLETIAAADRSNLGLICDLTELGREADLIDRIPEFLPLIHVVRLSDRRVRLHGFRKCNDAAPSVSAITRAFADAGYHGPFEFEHWSDAEQAVVDYDNVLTGIRSRFEAIGLESESET